MSDQPPVAIKPGPGALGAELPETPFELPYNRARVDELLLRCKNGERIDLLYELLGCVDWRGAFTDDDGKPLTLEDIARLHAYYRTKWNDIEPFFLADLLSTEFMTEQLAQGTVRFSPRLAELGRAEPKLWEEIRLFFRRKEIATALLAAADAANRAALEPRPAPPADA
jgi:hypothetical protein